jgi:hypothetical protein
MRIGANPQEGRLLSFCGRGPMSHRRRSKAAGHDRCINNLRREKTPSQAVAHAEGPAATTKLQAISTAIGSRLLNYEHEDPRRRNPCGRVLTLASCRMHDLPRSRVGCAAGRALYKERVMVMRWIALGVLLGCLQRRPQAAE